MEELAKHYLSLEVNIPSDVMWYQVPLACCDEKGTFPLWYSFKNSQTKSRGVDQRGDVGGS